MSNGHQPRLDVGVGRQRRIGAEGGEERLGPRVVCVDRADDGSAHSQHGRAVTQYHFGEGLLVGHRS